MSSAVGGPEDPFVTELAKLRRNLERITLQMNVLAVVAHTLYTQAVPQHLQAEARRKVEAMLDQHLTLDYAEGSLQQAREFAELMGLVEPSEGSPG